MNEHTKREMFLKLANKLLMLEQALEKYALSLLWEVYETNADLEEVKLVYQGYHRDLAETILTTKFVRGSYQTDYMLYNRNTQEIVGILFSEKSKRLRGECSQ